MRERLPVARRSRDREGAVTGKRCGPSRKRFEDRILGFPLPPDQAGETPSVSAVERGPDGWRLTRRSLMGLIAAGAFAGLPRLARAQTCSAGAFAHQALLESLSFFPDGNTLVSAGRDSFVKFWTIPERRSFPRGRHPSRSLAGGRESERKSDRRGDGRRPSRTLVGRRRNATRAGGTHGRGRRNCIHARRQPTGLRQSGSNH